MRILTRYILREVLSHALLGGVIFTFILFTSRLGKILEIYVRDSASLGDVTRLIAYFLPEALVVTIPMAVLVGILLGLSRLAADSEITAMRASGMGAFDFVRIISLISLIALVLGLANSLYLAPQSAAALLRLEDKLKYAQASFEVEPRVFDEDFRNTVLYVQDVLPGNRAALWRHVLIADLTQPTSPRITTADEAIVTTEPAVNGGPPDLHLLLKDGGTHQISDTDPNQYNIETFASADLPLQAGAQDDTHISRSDTPILALSLVELRTRMAAGDAPSATPAARKAVRTYRIEFNKRFSYPFACLVLMLVGVPLGLASKRGGKSSGFVLTILLVVVYYVISLAGTAFATQGKLPPFLGVWGANILFAFAGLLLLQQMAVGGATLSLLAGLASTVGSGLERVRRGNGQRLDPASPEVHRTLGQRLRSNLHIEFPLILDEYIMRAFLSNLALVLLTFWLLFTIFTFFELIGDIIRNRTPLVTVGDYLLNLIPYILYNVTPLCVLVAVLVTFGALARSSELTAMKAVGVSLYRIVLPVLVLAAVIAVALFAFDEFYLPSANRQQEALRNLIKGKPAQTFLRPDRSWISGQSSLSLGSTAALPNFGRRPASPQARPTEPVRIFYYQFFDPDRNVFANLTVFEFDPLTFTLQRRIFAASARWDNRVDRWIFENGWVRTFAGESIATYNPFLLTTFPQIKEEPQYFKKEDRQSQEMNYNELSVYINDLRQSGFDTKRLSVQLDRKLAYPAIALVMALLAMPFAFSTGKRGGAAGFAVAIALAVLYIGTSSLFEALGNVSTLPPALAAWSPDLLFALAGSWLLLRTPT